MNVESLQNYFSENPDLLSGLIIDLCASGSRINAVNITSYITSHPERANAIFSRMRRDVKNFDNVKCDDIVFAMVLFIKLEIERLDIEPWMLKFHPKKVNLFSRQQKD